MRTSFDAPAARQFLIGPDRGGGWIVRDDQGLCGALFKKREEALHFAKGECDASGRSEWRFVATLDLEDIFGPARRRT